MTKRLLPICFAIAATLAACSSPPLARTGADVDPVTLRAVWGQGPTGVGGDVLAALMSGSAGAAVRVVVSSPPATGDTSDERHAVEAVRAGDADVTVVRAGVLQLLGADSLAPLGAPFVVTNNDQAEAIARDPKLSEQLLGGLDKLGLVGLGLVPGGLRHPFAYGDVPLLGAGNYRDQILNVREDAGVQALLVELGATADHSVDTERQLAAGDRLRGIEVSVQQIGAVTLPAVQSANVTLYAKYDVAVVRRQVWDGLTGAQQQQLRDAFTRAVAVAMGNRVTEQVGQSEWCQTPGASSVLASEAQLATLRRALDPVTERIAADADAARTLDRMRELGVGTDDPSASACATALPESAAAYYVTPQGDQGVLDGLWRLEVDEQDLLDAGLSPQDAYINAGVWEFRIKDGYADGTQPDGRRCNADFAFDGEQVSMDMGVRGVEECGGVARGTYRLEGDRVFFDWQKELEYDVLLDQAVFAPGMVRIE